MPSINLAIGAALLSGLLDAGPGGPIVVPDGQPVNFAVVAAPPAAQGRAEAALPAAMPVQAAPPTENLPLGAPLRAAPPQRPSSGTLLRAIDPRSNELVRVGGALAVVLLLLGLIRGLLRAGGRLPGGGRPSGVLEVLGRYPVARSQSLLLLKLGGRVVLVHHTRSGMNPISEVSEPEEVAALLARVEASGRAQAGGFHGLLRRLSRRQPGEAFPMVAGGPSGGGERVVVDLTRRRRKGMT